MLSKISGSSCRAGFLFVRTIGLHRARCSDNLVSEMCSYLTSLLSLIAFPDQYVPELDERLGSNKVVIVEADFSHATAINIDLQHHEAGLRGFSSFAFIPGSEDEHVLAIRSVEENCVGANPAKDEHCEFRSYASVFELYTGEVLMEEVQLPQPVKFEGVEFANIHVRPKEGSAAAAKPPKEE